MILSAKCSPSLSGSAGSDESVDHCPSQATKRKSTGSETFPESQWATTAQFPCSPKLHENNTLRWKIQNVSAVQSSLFQLSSLYCVSFSKNQSHSSQIPYFWTSVGHVWTFFGKSKKSEARLTWKEEISYSASSSSQGNENTYFPAFKELLTIAFCELAEDYTQHCHMLGKPVITATRTVGPGILPPRGASYALAYSLAALTVLYWSLLYAKKWKFSKSCLWEKSNETIPYNSIQTGRNYPHHHLLQFWEASPRNTFETRSTKMSAAS